MYRVMNTANFELKPPLFFAFFVPLVGKGLKLFLKTCKSFGLTLQDEKTEFIVLIQCVVRN